jgi:hypothetical protein
MSQEAYSACFDALCSPLSREKILSQVTSGPCRVSNGTHPNSSYDSVSYCVVKWKEEV